MADIEINEQVLEHALKEILPQVDEEIVTTRMLMDHLSEHLHVDPSVLSGWKPTVRELVPDLLRSLHPGTESTDATDSVEEEEEEEKDEDMPQDGEGKRQQSRMKNRKRKNVIADDSDENDDTDEGNYDESEEKKEDSDSDVSDDDPPPSKKRRAVQTSRSKSSKPRREKKSKISPTANKSKTQKEPDPPGLASLKALAHAAGLMGPHVYKALKNVSSVDAAEDVLREALDKANIHFSGAYPSKQDVREAEKKKAIERELDGIDTSAIIEGGRRPRRAAVQRQHFSTDPLDTYAGEDGFNASDGAEEDDDGNGDDYLASEDAGDSDSSEATF